MINIIKTKSGQYRVQTIARNKKLLQQSERLPTLQTVHKHIKAVSKEYQSTNFFHVYYCGKKVRLFYALYSYSSFSKAIKEII